MDSIHDIKGRIHHIYWITRFLPSLMHLCIHDIVGRIHGPIGPVGPLVISLKFDADHDRRGVVEAPTWFSPYGRGLAYPIGLSDKRK
jgi:hypothetical protein